MPTNFDPTGSGEIWIYEKRGLPWLGCALLSAALISCVCAGLWWWLS